MSRRIVLAGVLALAVAAPVSASGQGAPSGAPATPPEAAASVIAAARDRVLPYVVSILVVREDFQQGEPRLSVSSGSGTVISPEGHIVTNAHVTQNGRAFRVVFADGRELPATRVGEDTLSDIAVLKLQAPARERFAHAGFAETLDLQPGDTVLAMGAPWGLSNSMSAGVVNNPRRLLVSLFEDEADYEDRLGDDLPTGRYYAWIQHDAAIAPGNSGGPLVDLRGRIVGVNARGMILGGDLAFAIPAREAAQVVAALREHGRVPRAYQGFRLRSRKGTPFDAGVLVHAVERGSPAEGAGLRAGDRIVAIDGEAIDAPQPVDVPALQRRLAELPVGREIRFDLERHGRRLAIDLTSGELPPDRGAEAAFAPFEASLAEFTPAMARRRGLAPDGGLVVTGVRPGGAAASARPALQSGDVLRRIGGKPVARIDDLAPWREASGEPRPVVLELERGRGRLVSVLMPRYGARERRPLPELPKAWSGAEVQPVPVSLARDLGLPTPGYRITRLYPDGPLARAGARVGDLITALDGEALTPSGDRSDEAFHRRVRGQLLSEPARFELVRDGKPQQLRVQLAPGPVGSEGLRTLELPRLRVTLRELGFYDREARRMDAAAHGLVVETVESGGPAGLAHLEGGDVLLAVGERELADLADLEPALDKALAGDERRVPLRVLRDDETRILLLDRNWLTESP